MDPLRGLGLCAIFLIATVPGCRTAPADAGDEERAATHPGRRETQTGGALEPRVERLPIGPPNVAEPRSEPPNDTRADLGGDPPPRDAGGRSLLRGPCLANEILVKLTPRVHAQVSAQRGPRSTGVRQLDELNGRCGLVAFEPLLPTTERTLDPSHAVFRWYRATVAGRSAVTSDALRHPRLLHALEEYLQSELVETAQLNAIVERAVLPDDARFDAQWNLHDPVGDVDIDAPEAWEVTQGNPDIVVAIVDSGVDWSHPDLAPNIWENPGEIPANGLDDDGNGYVDDVRGWDFTTRDFRVGEAPFFRCIEGPRKGADNDPMDENGHGTHVAGIACGAGNNGRGIAGVSWSSRLMALRFLNACGSGQEAHGVQAIVYATDNRAHVINNSWGCGGGTVNSFCFSQAVEDAVDYAHSSGVVVVSAAGNSGGDAQASHPASARGSLSVGATDRDDTLARFSNAGSKVDVVAPGVGILSTGSAQGRICLDTDSGPLEYCKLSGTSMAAPHVAGLAALVLSLDPALTPEQVRQIIRSTAEDLGTPGRDHTFAHGRIDAFQAVQNARPVPAPYIASPPNGAVIRGDRVPVVGDATGPAMSSWILEYGLSDRLGAIEPDTWTTIASGTAPVSDDVLATWDVASIDDGFYRLRLTIRTTTASRPPDGLTYEFEAEGIEVDRRGRRGRENVASDIAMATGDRSAAAAAVASGTVDDSEELRDRLLVQREAKRLRINLPYDLIDRAVRQRLEGDPGTERKVYALDQLASLWAEVVHRLALDRCILSNRPQDDATPPTDEERKRFIEALRRQASAAPAAGEGR